MNYKTFDDYLIEPRYKSNILHRSDISTEIEMLGQSFSLPIIASPMPDVCNGEMAHTLNNFDMLGIIHRFQSIEDQVKEFKGDNGDLPLDDDILNIGCAIGVIGDYEERFNTLYNNDCRIFCLDTANGFNIQVQTAIETLAKYQKENDRFYLIVGNVATKEGYKFLADCLIENDFLDCCIRVGIAGGSVCETKTETGIYVPMPQSIIECYSVKKILGKHLSEEYIPKIIADGGIRIPADMCKALYMGADAVMCGSIFAGTKQSPGNVINDNGKLVKLYRGAASFSVQQEFNEHEPNYVEGRESFVSYKGDVAKVIKRFQSGLQSSMSYMNSKTLKEFKEYTFEFA